MRGFVIALTAGQTISYENIVAHDMDEVMKYMKKIVTGANTVTRAEVIAKSATPITAYDFEYIKLTDQPNNRAGRRELADWRWLYNG